MITVPIHDMLILPHIDMYLKKSFFNNTDENPIEEGEEILFLMMKEEKKAEELTAEDFLPVGVSAKVVGIDNEGNVQIRVMERVTITDVELTDGILTAEGEIRPELDDLPEDEAHEKFVGVQQRMVAFVQNFPWGIWVRNYLQHLKNLSELICSVSGYMNLSWEEKYGLLAEDSRRARYEAVETFVYEFIEMSKVNAEAEAAQKEGNEQIYREQAIKKQIHYLQDELDAMHPENISDVRRFEKKIDEAGMNETAEREARKILNRMKQEGKDSHEYGMLYEYLDFVTGLSWKTEEFSDIDLAEAEEVLDEDHYGLKKVKERIIEQLAVMSLNRKQSGSILLFVGAPGTGKTSIGQSIAKALHRKYVRISLGGIHDEAEIRGHRRTYVGAMPGRIMDGIRRSGASNPVVVLDEVDKLTRNVQGDPASALLEVLDPEQNSTFTDHYMNVPYDLSNVLFVCTANTVDTIPEPLLNRMEVISFPGYTSVEKYHIARKHLLPRAMKAMGIRSRNLRVTDGAIRRIIEEYTAESGVRGLKKQMDHLCRKAAVILVRGEQKSLTVSEKRVPEYLGRQARIHDKLPEKNDPGIVTGLAWTQAGGEILFIEAAKTRGSGELIITGQLGDVMKESAQIALSLVKMMVPDACACLKESDLHIHVPAGAVPKDGPSAGITMVTALASLMTGRAVAPTYAMTGEVSLRGHVLPIGGLPEKLMAAQRAGVKTVFIPKDNVDDLEDVAAEVKEKLELVPVDRITEVLDRVLGEESGKEEKC